MTNEMPYSHSGKAARHCRFALVAAALVTFTFATASCSVVEDAVLIKTASANTATTKSRVVPAKASYGYQKTGNAAVTLVADASGTPAVSRQSYSGSSPYICSPSGFGQKSRCFLRP
ncbi:hypothetical protein L905_21325 [Agrobacterium sp. TS43]|jgi:hypothetical protein|uniref:Uncharacterized protein n=1 Tax=Agrobacterium leguminum TaxID=2792015 RepID=A0A9X3QUI7_9HYPH|nr:MULTISPECIES: hypothetical protein [Agrobacterium]UXT42853.1 hypothetical protein FY137_16355 [Agrobacterium tumefaciens]KDR89191.1 hypothetical protein K538_09180 [Agrobacterium tumefaciens GW4]KVK44985.1 hypothetical protein L904_26700 [Agrobacterium sp. LY4]KVK45031.1 hypothetical protein L903_26730 [Agrobacterium sp. JL28]KVK58017.1 hypothetical protein L906_26635 [Agrobacterium sp. TS45]